MSEKLIAVPESQLTDIGDAIRSKRDITTPIPVDEMPLQISLIEGGGDIPNATVSSDGKTLYTDIAFVPIIIVVFSTNAKSDSDKYVFNLVFKTQQTSQSYAYRPDGTYAANFAVNNERMLLNLQNGKLQIQILDSGYTGYNVAFDTSADYHVLTFNNF